MPVKFFTAIVRNLTFDAGDLEVTAKAAQLYDGDVIELMLDNDAIDIFDVDDNLSDLIVSRRNALHKAIREDAFAVVCYTVDEADDVVILDVQLASL